MIAGFLFISFFDEKKVFEHVENNVTVTLNGRLLLN